MKARNITITESVAKVAIETIADQVTAINEHHPHNFNTKN